MKQILIVDNYDSFVYNLVQIVEKNGKCKYDIVKNDGISPDSVSEYDGILLSPGPGIPKEAGMLCPLIETSYATTPILGICLGHQAIAEVFGCRLTRLEKPLHGHISPLFIIDSEEILFQGIENGSSIGHYHSWVIAPDSCPRELIVTATDAENNIMGIRHRRYPVRGLQFHPESFMSTEGIKIIDNWIASL